MNINGLRKMEDDIAKLTFKFDDVRISLVLILILDGVIVAVVIIYVVVVEKINGKTNLRH